MQMYHQKHNLIPSKSQQRTITKQTQIQSKQENRLCMPRIFFDSTSLSFKKGGVQNDTGTCILTFLTAKQKLALMKRIFGRAINKLIFWSKLDITACFDGCSYSFCPCLYIVMLSVNVLDGSRITDYVTTETPLMSRYVC